MKTVEMVIKKGDVYEPEVGHLIALTDKRAACINDLNKHGNFYLIALIRRVRKKNDDKNVYEVQFFFLSTKLIQYQGY